jgi:hypothetical protein
MRKMRQDRDSYRLTIIIFRDWAPISGYVDVWSTTSRASFYCYGSVLDNLSSDPTTVLPQ